MGNQTKKPYKAFFPFTLTAWTSFFESLESLKSFPERAYCFFIVALCHAWLITLARDNAGSIWSLEGPPQFGLRSSRLLGGPARVIPTSDMTERVATERKMKSRHQTTALGQIATGTAKPRISYKERWFGKFITSLNAKKKKFSSIFFALHRASLVSELEWTLLWIVLIVNGNV